MTTETTSPSDLREALAKYRPDLLRHCYRMLGCFSDAEEVVQEVLLKAWRSRDSYAADAPVLHWLMRIATNTCLNVLTRPGARGLPQLQHGPAQVGTPFEELEAADWVTPAPDAHLFPNPAQAAETREDVAIAFIALLQRLPPKQRAVLLLKDVVGWPAEEIAAALELTLPSVNSALHRARETVAARPRGPVEDPPDDVVRDYVRSWEERDLQSLVSLLKKDVVFAMPPHATWFEGADDVERFLQTPRFTAFWARGLRAVPTRANGLPAVIWYAPDADGIFRPHSIQLMRFEAGRLAEAINFIGPHYLRGFELVSELAR
jgi:RNA polymerase sigma-70 factor (ECF subfamily)